MKKLALILPFDYKLLSVAAILDVFDTVNRLYLENSQNEPFDISIIQNEKQIKQNGCSFHGFPVISVKSDYMADIVLIPSFTTNNMAETLGKNREYINWVKQQYSEGAEIASFCTGAFLFASTGLLNGKTATTHVDACNRFAIAFPEIRLKPNHVVTADGRLYTSGGSTSTFHLLLHIVQKYCGRETTIQVAKIFAIDMDRYQQSYFGTFAPSRNHTDELVKNIQENIEKKYHEIETIEEIVKDIPSSRRNIVRRFKQATGIPPIEYLQNVRIESAKKLLEQTNKSINEIVFHTGYNDPKSFRKVFIKVVGMPPMKYRAKFTASI